MYYDSDNESSIEEVIINDNESSLSQSTFDETEEDQTVYSVASTDIADTSDEYTTSLINILSARVYDEIFYRDEDYLIADKQNNQYVIGMSFSSTTRGFVLASTVSPTTFFQYSYQTIIKYLIMSSVSSIRRKEVDIIKIFIQEDMSYISVIKTYWICLIQRHWKKVYAMRAQLMKQRRILKNHRDYELRGVYKWGIRTLPTIYGMLSSYASLSKDNKYKN